jgi:hypothetical protein
MDEEGLDALICNNANLDDRAAEIGFAKGRGRKAFRRF